MADDDEEGAGEHMVPATDSENFSYLVWNGRVGLTFAYDGTTDTWLLATPISDDADIVALAVFTTTRSTPLERPCRM